MHIPNLVPPTASLSDSEAYERAEKLRQAGHGPKPWQDEREIQAKPIGLARDPREEFDSRKRQPEFTWFARDWHQYMEREE